VLPDYEHAVLAPKGAIRSQDVTTFDLPDGFVARTKAVGDAIAAFKPTVVHAHSSWGGVYSRLLKPKAPVVYEPHCFKFDDESLARPVRAAFWIAEAILARRAAALVTLSGHEDQLARSLDPEAQIVRIPNIASISPGSATPPSGFVTGDRVFMVGRLAPQKDPEFFGDVVAQVRAQYPEARFQWIGDGDETQRKALEDRGVEVTGWVEGDKLRELLSQPGLFFSSAKYEGFPITALDVAAFEHPIVARSIPALVEMGVPSARTSEECASLIIDALCEGPTLEAAITASRDINELMTEAALREQLIHLYDLAQGTFIVDPAESGEPS